MQRQCQYRVSGNERQCKSDGDADALIYRSLAPLAGQKAGSAKLPSLHPEESEGLCQALRAFSSVN